MDSLFRYSLKKDDTTFYYLQNGVLSTSLSPKYLTHYPKGWKESEVSFKRDLRYLAVFPEFGETIDFVLDGATILRNIYVQDQSEGDCILYVEILNSTTTQYDFFYQGALDFSNFNDIETGVSINVMRRGIDEDIKAKEETTFEIPLDGDADAITILLDGVLVKSGANWYPGNYSSNADNGVLTSFIPWRATFDQETFRTVPLTSGGDVNQISPFIRPHSQKGVRSGPYGAVISLPFISGTPSTEDGEYIFYNNTALTQFTIEEGFFQFAGKLPNVSGNKTVFIAATVVNKSLPSPYIVSQTILGQFSTTLSNVEVGMPFTLSGTFNVPSGSYVVISIYGIAPSLGSPDLYEAYFPVEFGYLKTSFLAKVAPTTAKGFHYIDMLKKLVEKISPGSQVVSPFMQSAQTDTVSRFNNWDTSAYWQITTCGNAMRGLPGSKIKTSFSDAFADVFSNLALAMSIKDNSIEFIPLSQAFDKGTKIAYIAETKDMNFGDFKDKIFNSLKIGYGNYDNKNVVGKNEFNTGLEFLSSKGRRYKKEDDLISNYRADVYGIESVRAETFGEDKLDNRSDNDVFIIECDPVPVSGQYKAYRPPGVITGVDDPSNIYNVTLSPGRRLRRHLSRIRSLIKKGSLVFQSTDKNPDLISTFGAGTVVETADIDLEPNTYNGHDVSRLFLPYVFEFDCVPPFNLYQMALQNPNGYIEFDFYGETMKGFILELSLTPASGNCRLKLLSHPENDESKLIHNVYLG